MDWEKFWKLFHKAWGQCHESPEYEKAVWRDMDDMLQTLERDLKKVVEEVRKGGVIIRE